MSIVLIIIGLVLGYHLKTIWKLCQKFYQYVLYQVSLKCAKELEKDSKLYSWMWLLLPNWRYYVRLRHDKNDKRFGKYSYAYNKPDRVRIWKINGYKYKLKL